MGNWRSGAATTISIPSAGYYTLYEWRSLVQGNGKTLSTTVTVPTPGLYTFYLWMREDGLIVDRIWLSTSPTAIAEANTGNGPTAGAQTTAR